MRSTGEDTFDVASDFGNRYEILIANTEALRKDVYRLRYKIFCEKLGYAMDHRDGLESDEYDRDSLHILLRDRASQKAVGCSRLVLPQRTGKIWLPFDLYGVPHVDRSVFNWNHVNHARSIEVSRLALDIPSDQPAGADKGVSTPFLATTLFYAATAIIIRLNIENVFMVIEPSLGRLISRFGIKLDQISPPFEYYGQRATFTTTGLRLEAELLLLKTPWQRLYHVVEQQLFAETSNQQVA